MKRCYLRHISKIKNRIIVCSDLLKVNPADDASSIESGGTANAPEDLNIDTNGETNGIVLDCASVTVDVQRQSRLNSNALIMNGAASLLDANGYGRCSTLSSALDQT